MLLFFIVFLVYNIQLAFTGKEKEVVKIENMSSIKATMWFFLGLIALLYGGNLIVEAAISISKVFGISDRVIGLTVLAIGTSLPELATSIAAIKKGSTDIAIGNVVGSNLFNVFFILGVSAVIHPIKVSDNSFFDILFLGLLTLLLFLFVLMGTGKKINRIEGILFVALFFGYTIYLLIQL